MADRRQPTADATVVRRLVSQLGGRFSTEAGIDVDAGADEIERWFLAATLFGTRISAATAIRTFRVLDRAGVSTIADAGRRTWEQLVSLLDAGGYARYDYRTADRLLALSAAVSERNPDGVAAMGAASTDPASLAAALDELPGWGPVTITAFLRELRGVWPAAAPPVDARTESAARHLGLVAPSEPLEPATLVAVASRSGVDPRDLEAALVRLALAHQRTFGRCVDSDSICAFLDDRPAPE